MGINSIHKPGAYVLFLGIMAMGNGQRPKTRAASLLLRSTPRWRWTWRVCTSVALVRHRRGFWKGKGVRKEKNMHAHRLHLPPVFSFHKRPPMRRISFLLSSLQRFYGRASAESKTPAASPRRSSHSPCRGSRFDRRHWCALASSLRLQVAAAVAVGAQKRQRHRQCRWS